MSLGPSPPRSPADSRWPVVGLLWLASCAQASSPATGVGSAQRLRPTQALAGAGQTARTLSALIPGDTPGSYLALLRGGGSEGAGEQPLRIYRIQRIQRIQPQPPSPADLGAIDGFIELSDPDRHVRFALRNHFRRGRILTAADFEPGALVRASDGTLWLGEAQGPSLLHCDGQGRLLEPPIPLALPGQAELQSPHSPALEESSALRILNALDGHAQERAADGRGLRPVFSPAHTLIADGDARTAVPSRVAPPTGSGLAPASSEIFDLGLLRQAGYPVVAWTVNEPSRMTGLLSLGVDGLISDRPDLLLAALRGFDGDRDGTPDFLTAEGLIDRARFDAQGHRGGRDLRPENTLPAMEVALDFLMTTLETDAGISRDGVVVLSHDPLVQAGKCRRSDGLPYAPRDEVRIRDRDAAQLQREFICDKLFRGPQQKNDPGLSPVSLAFAARAGLPHLYAIPTGQQLFDFVAAYLRHYREGEGRTHPEAGRRARNAEQVRFNIETKLNPRREFADRTIAPEPFADAVAALIEKNRLSARAQIQSFDLRTLLHVQHHHPAIRTALLLGDFPRFADPTLPGSDDGTNLQDEDGKNTPWLAGLLWPYRRTAPGTPPPPQTRGGIAAMSLSTDGQRLLLFLETPLATGSGCLRGLEFDLATRRFLPTELRLAAQPPAARHLAVARSLRSCDGIKDWRERRCAGPPRLCALPRSHCSPDLEALEALEAPP
jgi:glycerophosphoryl diester phosphodiesterase